MKVTVQGHHMDIGQALQTHIEEKMNALNEKYFGRAVNVTVTMSKETHHMFRANISLTIGKDIQVQATGSEHDAHQAFDSAAEKVAKQMRRYKRRLRDHHDNADTIEHLKALEYTMGYGMADDELANFDPHNDDFPEGHDEAVVIAEMTTPVPTLTVSDAVMRLTLSGNNALMFYHAVSGDINMVYRRQDGNYGWVDPKSTAKKNNKVA